MAKFNAEPVELVHEDTAAADGQLSFESPVSQPGDYVVLRAEMDCIIAFSACPQDMVPINGVDRTPTEAHFEIV